MRSILQFVGFASSVVWATLLSGILLTATVQADPPSDPGLSNTCENCYSCNTTYTACDYVGVGQGCTDTHQCRCVRIQEGFYLCKV